MKRILPVLASFLLPLSAFADAQGVIQPDAAQAVASGGVALPAHNAYSVPDGGAFNVRRDAGVIGWKDVSQHLVWHLHSERKGAVATAMKVFLPEGFEASFTLEKNGRKTTAKVTGKGPGEPVYGVFGQQALEPGFNHFSFSTDKALPGDARIEALVLKGAALEGAHFDATGHRGSRSLHLWYKPKQSDVVAFYNESAGITDPLHTYYCVSGFYCGYFGYQVNGPKERRLIFSVWDAADEAIDRNKVESERRTRLLGKMDGAVGGDFGHEGTGGHSHLVYPWKTGERQRFMVVALPQERSTLFAGLYWFPESKSWKVLSGFERPLVSRHLEGLYSFVEDFSGTYGFRRRTAVYGNSWTRSKDGAWAPVMQVNYPGYARNGGRIDVDSGVTPAGDFYLSSGGFEKAGRISGMDLTRKETPEPKDLEAGFKLGSETLLRWQREAKAAAGK